MTPNAATVITAAPMIHQQMEGRTASSNHGDDSFVWSHGVRSAMGLAKCTRSHVLWKSLPRLLRPEGFRGATRDKIDVPVHHSSGHAIRATQLQEIHRRPGRQPRHRHRRARRFLDRQRQAQIDAASARTDGHVAKIVVVDDDVGRKGQRALRSEHGQEAGNAARVGDIGRRKHPPVHDRQIIVRDLAPLPADAFPESPVVIVVADRVVERERLVRGLERASQRARPGPARRSRSPIRSRREWRRAAPSGPARRRARSRRSVVPAVPDFLRRRARASGDS